MIMYGELLDFLRNNEFFIEAEAKPSTMHNFVNDYNERYNENLSFQDDGMIILKEDANKWGLELRSYCNFSTIKNIVVIKGL